MEFNVPVIIICALGALIIIGLIALSIVLFIHLRRRRAKQARRKAKELKPIDKNPENPSFEYSQFKQMGPLKMRKEVKLAEHLQPDHPMKLDTKRALIFKTSDCHVYDVGSAIELCVDEHGRPIDEHTMAETPPSKSAYEDDTEFFDGDDPQGDYYGAGAEGSPTDANNLGPGSSPTNLLSDGEDQSVLTPGTSMMTPAIGAVSEERAGGV